jgi:hypothetical protein
MIIYQQVAKQEEDTIYFDLKKLQQLPNFKSNVWLKEFEFTAWRIYMIWSKANLENLFCSRISFIER